MIQSLELFDRVYNGENIQDMQGDLVKALSETYNPELAGIQRDNNGFMRGSFRLILQWDIAV